MVHILKELELMEVSLVDVPANPLAEVPIVKRAKPMDDTKKEDTDFVKQLADKDAKIAELEKALADKEAVEKAAKEEWIEYEGEKILKSAVPAPILKRLEALEIEKAEAALEKRAKDLIPHFPGDVAKHKKLVKSLDAELEELLRAADALFAEKLQEVGKGAAKTDMKSAVEKMDEMAKSIAVSEKMTYAAAYTKMLDTAEGKELYKQSLKEKN